MQGEVNRETEKTEKTDTDRQTCRLTPTECTMHLGVPVVPDEYMTKRGWLKGTCSNFNSDPSCPFTKSSNSTL